MLRAAFDKNGFWDDDEGMLVMVKDGEIVGEVEYFLVTHYLQIWSRLRNEAITRRA